MYPKLSRFLFVILLITIINSVTAQQLLPVPRASIELLSNTSFDIDSDGDKLPDDWSGKNTAAVKVDKIKCDKPDKLVAHTGTCAFMFRGNSDASGGSKIQQKISNTGAILNGVDVSFSVYLDARSGVSGATIGKAKIKYSDATVTKFSLTIPAASLRGVADYVQISDTQTISIGEGVTITKVKVDFRYKETSGKFLIDDASFAVITADPTATPTDAETATLTDTIQVTPTDPNLTQTPTEEIITETPTDQPTATFTQTASSTPTATATSTATATPTITPSSTATHTAVPSDTPTKTPCPCQLIASDGATNDFFGSFVAIDGDTAVIGARGDSDNGTNAGSAYVFVHSSTIWTQQQKLMPADGATFDEFGFAAGVSGDTVVIGAYGDDDNGTDSGAAYVYSRTGTTWTLQQKLIAPDGAADDLFGYAVSIFGDTIVISAIGDDDQEPTSGSAYVFVRSGTTWTLQQKLIASDGAFGDQFGQALAINGDSVVIGAILDSAPLTSSGSAYVFVRSGTTWTQQQKLTASDGAVADLFGSAVAINGDSAIIGVALDDDHGTDSGSAYVFTRSGTVWTQQQKLTADDGAATDNFGRSVGINNDTVVISAHQDDDNGTNSGSAYVFTRSGTVWTQQQKLTSTDNTAFDYFANSVAISNNTILAGVMSDIVGPIIYQGSAWVFELP